MCCGRRAHSRCTRAGENMPNEYPLTLKPRHELAAMLIATGRYTDKEIAEHLHITPTRLAVVKRSPLFQVLVTKFRERVHEAIYQDAVSEIMEDAQKNIKVLKGLRDGDFIDAKVAKVQLGAAAILFDRQVPKTVHTTREVSGTVTLEKKDASRLAAIAEEDDAIDTTAVTVTPAKTFAEFAAEHTEDDDDGA